MDVNLQEILSTERDRYFSFFVDSISSLKKEMPDGVTELAIMSNDKNLIDPFNIVRIDFIAKKENEEYYLGEIRLDKNLEYNALEFEYSKLQIQLNPFCWNSCEIKVDKLNIEKLKQWITKWLKIDKESENELAYSIHSCSTPQIDGSFISFTIDFGTSSTEVFVEFLNFIANNGSSKVFFETTEV